MKKISRLIVAILLMITSVAVSLGQGVKTFALDEGDNCFLEFVYADSTFEGDITFSHSPLYNQELNEHGREYEFSIGDINGYALMIEFKTETQTFYEIEELFYNKQSPFADCTGLPVYIAHNTYLEYKDQAFYDVITGNQVSEEIVLDCAYNGFNYFGGTTATFTNTTFTIEYARKTTEQYSIQYDLPNLIGSVIGGSCAHTAGAVILTYYDRFCANLIPNYEPMVTIGPFIAYDNGSPETIQVAIDLVDLMLIGEPHQGTTFSEFELGMETYAEQHGYTYTSTNLFSWGSFSLNNYKNAVQNNRPVALFLTNFTMNNGINEREGQDTIGCGFCPVSHVAAGCGYRIDTYYDADGDVITTRTYLKVASGLNSYGIGYLSLNETTTISKAISILVS